MFRSALAKLMLWYVTLAMLLSVLFSVVIYHFATNEIDEGLYNQYSKLEQNDIDHDYDDNISQTVLKIRSRQLLNDLFIINAVVLLGSTALSYILAKRTLRPIEAAHQAQIRFTAEASHELKTPIAAMRADTESVLMQSSSSPGLLLKTLKANLEDLDRLEKLSSHLLQMSRYQTGHSAESQRFNLLEATVDVIDQLSRVYVKKAVKVETSSQPIQMTGDPIAIKVLLSTILDNAFKYSKSGGKIQITMNRQGKVIKIRVKDDGIGINTKDIDHVFDYFYRSSSSLDQSKDNSYGLGLPIAKDIVNLHKGRIDIKSKGKGGTTVDIELPSG